MNATKPPSKRSRIERTVDRIIFFMFGLLFSMCLTGCIYFAWWTSRYMTKHWYLGPGPNVPREYDSSKPGIVAVTNFITAFILYGEIAVVGSGVMHVNQQAACMPVSTLRGWGYACNGHTLCMLVCRWTVAPVHCGC